MDKMSSDDPNQISNHVSCQDMEIQMFMQTHAKCLSLHPEVGDKDRRKRWE